MALGRVLVVDDEEPVRMVIRDILELKGYLVREARNGAEALQVLKEHPVDVALIDLIMPEKEGLETIGQVRTQYPQIPVIAMSGAFYSKFLKVAEDLGAQAILMKPFPPEQLLQVIERALKR